MIDTPLALDLATPEDLDARREAEFWRMLLGLVYRAGDEAPEDGDDDADWLVLTHPDGRRALAVQEVEQLTAQL